MTVWHPWEQCCHQPFTSLAFNSTQLTPTRILRALPWQPSNGGRRPSFGDLQLHSLLQPSRAWRSCVATGSYPRWHLFHNVKLSLPLRLTADKCCRIWIEQPPLLSDDIIHWSRWWRVEGYREEVLGWDIDGVPYNLPAATSLIQK